MSQIIKFYFTSSMLNMFRTLIHPSSGACDFSILSPHLLCVLVSMCVGVSVRLVGVVSVLQTEACHTDNSMYSNTTMSIKVYLMAIVDNYMFRPLLAIFRLSSRELNLGSYYIHWARTWCRDLYLRALLRNVICICVVMLWLETW